MIPGRSTARAAVALALAGALLAGCGQAKQPKVDAAPPEVREIAWKAQCRLFRRYRMLIRKGKLKTVAIVAIARELAWTLDQLRA